MIRTFSDKETELIYNGYYSKKLPTQIQRQAYRKLLMIAAAVELRDLVIPPGNKLESLSKNRKGQHSIRINDQWRICFVWKDSSAAQVEITDYH